MIRVERTDEPADFNKDCRQKGLAWLAKHSLPEEPSDDRPYPFWTAFLPELRKRFHQRCAYLGLFIASGTVDHFLSCKGKGGRALAYEWSNYRYSDSTVNSAKKPAWDGKLLDPFEVDDSWFEVLLPSCELRIVTENVPADMLARVEFTVDKLGLKDDEQWVELRYGWYEQYKNGDMTLELLRKVAPLVAVAVEKEARMLSTREG